MIAPIGAKCFSEGYRMVAETFQYLKKILKENGYSTGVGDEGGFAPDLNKNEEGIELIIEAIEKAGYELRNTIIWDRRNLVNRAGIFGWPNNYITLGTTLEYILDFWCPPQKLK